MRWSIALASAAALILLVAVQVIMQATVHTTMNDTIGGAAKTLAVKVTPFYVSIRTANLCT